MTGLLIAAAYLAGCGCGVLLDVILSRPTPPLVERPVVTVTTRASL